MGDGGRQMNRKKKNEAISQLLAEYVGVLRGAAVLFRELVNAEPGERSGWLEELQGLETTADQMFVDLNSQVPDTFITPLDREDLYRLVENLDEVIDHLELSGALVVGFDLQELPQGILAGADKLVTMSETVAEVVNVLKKPKKVGQLLFDFYSDESQMDANYRSMLFEVLRPGVADPIRAMQETILIEAFEAAASALEKLVQALGTTSSKET